MRKALKHKHKAAPATRRRGTATAPDTAAALDALAQMLRELLDSHAKPEPLEDWMPGTVVCDMLNISPRTLEHWRADLRIPYSKVNGKCYYRRSDIERLLHQNLHRKEDRHE